jgi:hypothetical protein
MSNQSIAPERTTEVELPPFAAIHSLWNARASAYPPSSTPIPPTRNGALYIHTRAQLHHCRPIETNDRHW